MSTRGIEFNWISSDPRRERAGEKEFHRGEEWMLKWGIRCSCKGIQAQGTTGALNQIAWTILQAAAERRKEIHPTSGRSWKVSSKVQGRGNAWGGTAGCAENAQGRSLDKGAERGGAAGSLECPAGCLGNRLPKSPNFCSQGCQRIRGKQFPVPATAGFPALPAVQAEEPWWQWALLGLQPEEGAEPLARVGTSFIPRALRLRGTNLQHLVQCQSFLLKCQAELGNPSCPSCWRNCRVLRSLNVLGMHLFKDEPGNALLQWLSGCCCRSVFPPSNLRIFKTRHR